MMRFEIKNSIYTQTWTSYLADSLSGSVAKIIFRNWSNDFGFEHWALTSILSIEQLSDKVPVLFHLNNNKELIQLKAALYLVASFEYDIDLLVDEVLCFSLVDTVLNVNEEVAGKEQIITMGKKFNWESF